MTGVWWKAKKKWEKSSGIKKIIKVNFRSTLYFSQKANNNENINSLIKEVTKSLLKNYWYALTVFARFSISHGWNTLVYWKQATLGLWVISVYWTHLILKEISLIPYNQKWQYILRNGSIWLEWCVSQEEEEEGFCTALSHTDWCNLYIRSTLNFLGYPTGSVQNPTHRCVTSSF